MKEAPHIPSDTRLFVWFIRGAAAVEKPHGLFPYDTAAITAYFKGRDFGLQLRRWATGG